jgi:hypothetical protein
MARRVRSIYVQIDIRGPIDRVWTEIRYLPRPDEGQAQRFLYATRIGLGLTIRGEGESVGSRAGFGQDRCSSLKFWSEDPKSLIREGSGYWKYVSCGENGQRTRFVTGYDYQVRFGVAGRLFDRVLFRPLIGWATAWSFDRLRLWIEKDIDPAISRRQSLVYMIARLAVAVVWLYQGAVPKLIFRHPDELALLHAAGMSDPAARGICVGIGWMEVAFGLILLVAWRSLWPLWFTLAAMPVALLVVATGSPDFLADPFNPFVLNLSVFALAAVALVSARDLPSASHCLRRPPRSEP